MAKLLSLKIPPGVYKNGTDYESKGRYVDSNLIRWHQGQMRPLGGWTAFSTAAVTGKARALKIWRDNNSTAWIATGTDQGLFIMDRSGGLSNITPAGFVAGRPDAMIGGGYGSGPYGAGTYGTARSGGNNILDATVWSLDLFGQYLVGINPEDGRLSYWTLDPSVPATVVENSPSGVALVTTNENILMVLGAGGNPRLVQWCDQENLTQWDPDAEDQAGRYPLISTGRLMCGRVIAAGVLIFTDAEVFLASYLSNELVYGFEPAGRECGIISRQAVVALASVAYWMGRNAFYSYNGFVQAIDCDVADYVFGNINPLQISKIFAVESAEFGEITWYYPSLTSTEIDSYVTLSHTENHWEVGSLSRTCGVDAGVYSVPILVDPAGIIWSHETGFDYGGGIPYARTGPIEIGDGDNVVFADGFLPDLTVLDAVSATFFVKFYPQDTEYAYGPYPLVPSTDVQFEGRQIELLYTANIGTPVTDSNGDVVTDSNGGVVIAGTVGVDWRIGTARLSLTPGGER